MLYLHDTFTLLPGRCAAFVESFDTRYRPMMTDLGARLVDLWQTASMSLPWPAAIALWEVDDADAAQRLLRETHGGSHRDTLSRWMDSLDGTCTGGRGRILNPSAGVPTLAALRRQGVSTRVCVHEVITTLPDHQAEYLRQIEKLWLPSATRLGRIWIGTYATQWRNDECLSIWALEDPWLPFPRGEAEATVHLDPDVAEWLRRAGDFRAGFDDGIIVSLTSTD